MPLTPLTVTLSDGQKIAAMKRFRQRYADELAKIEAEMTEILTNLAEADFLAQYLGEQAEIQELRARKADIEAKEVRRQRLGKIIERLDQYTPQQKSVSLPPPNQTPAGGSPKPGGIKRY
jgi:F0F1-type ATP synthase alpha subunit